MIRIDCLGLGSKNFKLKAITEIVPKSFIICVLDDWYDDPLPKLKKLVKKGYFRFYIHCNWTPVSHKIIPIKKLKDKCKKWEAFACQYPGVTVWLSHSLEYNESSKK